MILSQINLVYGPSLIREVLVRIHPYLQCMQTREIHKKRFKRTSRIFALVFVLALVAIPSILHTYSGFGISPVTMKSSNPAVEIGDAFITVQKKASQLTVGDIVTLRDQDSGQFLPHRILEIVQQGPRISISAQVSDNPTSASQTFTADALAEVPVTVTNIKGLGHAITFLTSFQGKQISLSLMVLGNLIALFLFLFRKKIKTGISNTEKVFRGLYADLLDSNKRQTQRANTYKDLYLQASKELEEMRSH